MHKAPVGTGPMKVVSIKTAEEYVFEKNTDYTWGSPKGEAKVSKIVVRNRRRADSDRRTAGRWH